MSLKLSKITGILHKLKEEYPSSILMSLQHLDGSPLKLLCFIVGFSMQRDLLTSKARYLEHLESWI